MDSFNNYLKTSKESVVNIKPEQNVHIVMGNESCDLDSTVSALMLGYLLNERVYNEEPTVQVLSILNVNSEDFPLRTENCYVLKKVGIDLNFLIFRNNINLKEIYEKCTLRISLVDHHVLSKEDEFLSSCVVQIFDHRPIDPNVEWNEEDVNVKIREVGSCATLITEEIFKIDETILSDETATLLYDTIVYDTIALRPEFGKAKELDISIAEKLEKKFNYTENRQIVYETLWDAHNDVSHLTPKQLLSKDLKTVDGIPVPGLPMLVEQYLKLPDVSAAIKLFAEEKNTPLIILMGLEAAKQDVRRDLAVFSTDHTCNLFKTLISKLKEKQDLCLNEIQVDVRNVVCYRQDNVKLSRKQILPIIKEAVEQSKN